MADPGSCEPGFQFIGDIKAWSKKQGLKEFTAPSVNGPDDRLNKVKVEFDDDPQEESNAETN